MKELRSIQPQTDELKLRSTEEENGSRFISGYAAVFDTRSKMIVEPHSGKRIAFYEFIEPRAFDSALDDNIIANINHNPERMLGRTQSQTLTLEVDETGLRFNLLVPNTTEGNDLWEMIQRGDYAECSFAFIIDSDRWEKGEELPHRYVERVAKLIDVSIVTNGAYDATSVDAEYIQRSVDNLETQITEETEETTNEEGDTTSTETLSDNSERTDTETLSDEVDIEIRQMQINLLKLKHN